MEGIRRNRSVSVLTFLALFVLSGAFTYQLILGPSYSGIEKSTESRIFNNIIPLLFFIYYLVLLIQRPDKAQEISSYFWPLPAFIVVGFISAGWSYDPLGSFVDGITLLLLVVGAFGIAVGVPQSTFVNVASTAFLMMMVSSIIYIYLVPSYGLMSLTAATQNSTIAGTPQGIFLHKNTLGYMSGLVFIFSFGIRGIISYRRRIALLVTSLACLILSDSATNWVAVVMAVSVYLLWLVCLSFFRNRAFAMGFILIIVFYASVLIFYFLGDFISVVGRDVTLTGRVHIWNHALAMIYDRPWSGYGMASIWETGFGHIPENPYFASPHAHNTWLEVMLMTGVPGLILALSLFVVLGRSSFLNYDSKDDLSGVSILIYIYMLVVSFAEFSMFRGNSFPFLFMIVIFGYMHLRRLPTVVPVASGHGILGAKGYLGRHP